MRRYSQCVCILLIKMANRTRILQIVGVGAALVSGYLLYRYFQDRKAEVTTKEYQLKELDDAKMNEAIDELREVLTDKALHLQEDIIDRIFRKSTDIIKDSYADLTIHYRKRQRATEDPLEEIKLILEYEAKVKELKEISLNCILARLNIPEDVWNKEVLDWLTPERDEEWKAIIDDMQTELEHSVPLRQKNPSKEHLHQMFQHHIKYLQQLDPAKYNLSELPKEEVIGVINHIVSNHLFKKFKVEKENIQSVINNLSQEEYEEFTKYFEEISSLGTGFIMEDE